MSSTVANSLGMTSFHYNEMLEHVQEQMTILEEDCNFDKSIVRIAEEIRPSVLSQNEKKELEIKGRLNSLSL